MLLATPAAITIAILPHHREADLDALSAALLATVDETLKPEQVTLWLTRRGARNARRNAFRAPRPLHWPHPDTAKEASNE
jgi:hypothetical protein